jgi:hypothetical protein
VATTLVVGAVALWTVPKVDSTTYLGGVTEVGAGELTPKIDPTKPGDAVGGDQGLDDQRDVPLWDRPVTAVGDSVLLGARSALAARFPKITVDAALGRQPAQIAERVREREQANRLGDVLVIQTGTNGPPDPQGFADFLGRLSGLDLVVVLTVRSEVPWMDQSNAIIERAAQDQSNVSVADWARASVGNPQYLYKDGTHLTSSGQRAYSRLIWDTVRAAAADGAGSDAGQGDR